MRESLSTVTTLTTSRFPYPGLRPFQPKETDIFFGREDQSDQLLEKLQGETHFLAVLGLSGSGKSSLVRTGLLAGLQRGYLAEAGVRWRVAEMRPGTQPFENLAQALIDPAPPAKPALPEYRQLFTAPDPVAFLAADLRRGRWSVHELLRDLAVPAGENLLLIVDQFEEIFRYYQQTDANQAAAFVELLLASSTPWAEKEATRHRLYVVITMRSEFIGECARFYQLPEAINQGLFLVPRLMRDQLREAIEGPARVCGGQVAAELVNRLLNDVGTDPDQLPLLQHALMRMWQLAEAEPRATQAGIRLTLQHYAQTGPLTATDQPAALSKHAEEALKDCTPSQQRLAELLFRSLTGGVSSQRDTRRPVTIGEVAKVAAVSWSEIAAVVEMFRRADRCFLLPPLPQKLEETTLIDISHESLIRQWQRLDQWAKAESEEAQMYQRLEDSAQRWDKGEGSLWRSPELEAGLAWRDRVQPTAVWASRYGQHFDLAMRFLEESTSGQVRELQRVTQQKELAMQAINLLTYELVDELATLPRTTPILVRVLEKNVALLEEIFALDPATTEAQREKSSNLTRLGDCWLKLGKTPEATAAYQKSLAIDESLAQADPSNTQAQRDLSISYNKIGDVQVQQGNTPAALAAYQKSLEMRDSLAQADPSNTQAQRDLSVSYNKIGDVQVQQGNTPAALAAYQQSLAIAESLAQADPSNTQAQRDLYVSHIKIGDVQVQQGNTPAALAAYQKSLAIAESLAQADPSNTQAQRDLYVSHIKIGDVQVQQGNTPAALAAYQKSLAIAESLAQADPSNTQAQRDLAASYSRIGDVQVQQGNTPAALAAYQKSLAIAETLAQADPSNTQAQRDLAASYDNIGNVQVQQGNTPAALAAYQKSLAIAESLAQADPSNTQAQRDLYVSHVKIGDVQVQQGNTPAALAAYQKSLAIAESLAQADPSNTQAQRDLSVSYYKLERVQELLGNSDEAKHFLQQAISLVQPLTVQDPQNQILQDDLAEYQSVLARLQGDEQLRLQQPQAAVQSYQQALAISLRLAAVNQHDMEVQRDVYRHYQKLGDAYAALPDPHAAATAYQQALQQLETRWPLVNTATAPVSLARREWEEIRRKLEGVQGGVS